MITTLIAIVLSITSILVSAYILLSYRRELNLLRRLVKLLAKRKYKDVLGKTKKLRKRYIVFTIVSEHSFSRKEIEEAVRKNINKVYGFIGLARADPKLVYYEPSLKKGVIRTSHLEKELVITALSLVREVNGKKLVIIPLKTTGTIKRAKKYLYLFEKL